jgi:1-acyl-sn-glycerol-3-phosphate acyltransferase
MGMSVVAAPVSYQVPWGNRLSRAFLGPIFRGIFHLLSSVHIEGQENIPARGAYLIAFNHVSLFDPPFVLAFWPTMPEAAGAVDIWNRSGQATLVRLYGGIPIRRGEFNRKMLEQVLAVLQAGRALVIAPEGGRSHQPGMRPAYPGVAYIAERAQVPVVPVGVVGATDDFLKQAVRGKRPRLEMRIGKPIILPPVEGRGAQRRAGLQRNSDLVMQRIAELLPSNYWGVYGESEPFATQTTE